MMRVRWGTAARAELREAVEYYEAEKRGRGARFRRRVDAVVALIRSRPYAGPVLEGDFRRVMVHPFPYSLIYVPEPGELRIVAVMHHRRHPDAWRGRSPD
ncbi:MAG TPA: type II toxin-antitoxin system RelE/ParE family toxin [Longimicrobiaceae bacterium]|nr:type II toxin-antitoxin system RelE/ParE family toxin [Longimicrobiaceae bacterium]